MINEPNQAMGYRLPGKVDISYQIAPRPQSMPSLPATELLNHGHKDHATLGSTYSPVPCWICHVKVWAIAWGIMHKAKWYTLNS